MELSRTIARIYRTSHTHLNSYLFGQSMARRGSSNNNNNNNNTTTRLHYGVCFCKKSHETPGKARDKFRRINSSFLWQYSSRASLSPIAVVSIQPRTHTTITQHGTTRGNENSLIGQSINGGNAGRIQGDIRLLHVTATTRGRSHSSGLASEWLPLRIEFCTTYVLPCDSSF